MNMFSHLYLKTDFILLILLIILACSQNRFCSTISTFWSLILSVFQIFPMKFSTFCLLPHNVEWCLFVLVSFHIKSRMVLLLELTEKSNKNICIFFILYLPHFEMEKKKLIFFLDSLQRNQVNLFWFFYFIFFSRAI